MAVNNSWMISFLNDLGEIARKRGLDAFAEDLEEVTRRHAESLGHVEVGQRLPAIRDDKAAEVLPFTVLRGER